MNFYDKDKLLLPPDEESSGEESSGEENPVIINIMWAIGFIVLAFSIIKYVFYKQ